MSSTSTQTWLQQIEQANTEFISANPSTGQLADLPKRAIITCMDPRINLSAMGIQEYDSNNSLTPSAMVIRTLGGLPEYRAMVVNLFQLGIREMALMLHTDCGCCFAHNHIDLIIENMQDTLSAEKFTTFKTEIGEPFPDKLQNHLRTFPDPRAAIHDELRYIRSLPYIPDDLVIHGLLYELHSGAIEIVVDGYAK